MPDLFDRLRVRDPMHGMVPLTLVRVLALYLESQGVALPEVLGKALSSRLASRDEHQFSRLPAEDYCRLLLQAADERMYRAKAEGKGQAWMVASGLLPGTGEP